MTDFEDSEALFEQAMAQIPERCRRCSRAQTRIGLAFAFNESTGAFWPTVADILENCVDDGQPRKNDGDQAKIIGSENAPLLFLPFSDSSTDCLYQKPA